MAWQLKATKARASTDVARASADVARVSTDVARASTDVARASTDVARASTDVTRASTDVARASTDVARVSTDAHHDSFTEHHFYALMPETSYAHVAVREICCSATCGRGDTALVCESCKTALPASVDVFISCPVCPGEQTVTLCLKMTCCSFPLLTAVVYTDLNYVQRGFFPWT